MAFTLTEAQIKQFNTDGYLVLENFVTAEDCDAMKTECRHIIDKDLVLADHPMTVFSTTKQTSDDYFMNSADKIRFFFEKEVFDDKGNLLREKHLCVNKIGHALHELNPTFKRITHLPQVQNTAKSLSFRKAIVPQSMCIFKQPGVGGKVVPHQDGTFLHMTPGRVMGFWIAIEDADVENGCLGFIPGSHTWPIPRKMVRNTDTEGPSTIFIGEEEEYDMSKFVNVPVKRGSCILIHDHVVHKSEKNTSDRSRLIYTFHIAESDETHWNEGNWLQPTESYSFPALFS